MRSWKNKIAAVILLVAVSGGVTYYASFLSYKNTVDNIEITDMTAEGVSDGTYEGESDAGFVRARVKEEKIVDIVLVEHKNGRGKRAEKVVDEVLTEQTTDVETVSGATNSSLVILQAIERALEKGADSGTEA